MKLFFGKDDYKKFFFKLRVRILLAVNHILIPYFVSGSSDRAVQYGIELGEKYDCVISVMPFIQELFVNSLGFLSFTPWASFLESQRPELEEFREQAIKLGVKFHIEIASDYSKEKSVLDFVKNNNVDFIIYGKPQKFFFFNMDFGLLEHVQENVKCPVKVID